MLPPLNSLANFVEYLHKNPKTALRVELTYLLQSDTSHSFVHHIKSKQNRVERIKKHPKNVFHENHAVVHATLGKNKCEVSLIGVQYEAGGKTECLLRIYYERIVKRTSRNTIVHV